MSSEIPCAEGRARGLPTLLALVVLFALLPLTANTLSASDRSDARPDSFPVPGERFDPAPRDAVIAVGQGQVSPQDGPPILWYFWRDDCPFCQQADPWLDGIGESYPQLDIRRVEVVRDLAGRTLFQQLMAERGAQATAVPTFILEEDVWVGFSAPLAEQIEQAIASRLGEVLVEPPVRRSVLDLGPLGRMDVGTQGLATATLLIAFVDGFNPCSLWVLTVLIAMIMGTRSRVRIAAVGLTFLLVTASIYGLFITGLFVALDVAAHLGWIRIAVAFLALGFGLIHVKDFLAFRRGPSLSIPDRFKPRIYRGGRALREDRPLAVTLGITVALAAGVALMELPCTAGFPVIWSTLVSEAGLGRTSFLGLLLLYLMTYLSVEIAILVGAIVTLRAIRLQEGHGRTLKLVGGMVMIALAGVLFVDPSIMESLSGSLVVIVGAVGLSLLVLLAERLWGGPGSGPPGRGPDHQVSGRARASVRSTISRK